MGTDPHPTLERLLDIGEPSVEGRHGKMRLTVARGLRGRRLLELLHESARDGRWVLDHDDCSGRQVRQERHELVERR